MTVKNVFDHYVKSLSSLYEKSEAENISNWVIEDVLGITKTEMLLRSEEVISELKANNLAWKMMRLMKGEPVQYVLGYTFFYGLKLKVNKTVLIPRAETEELVEWIVDEEKKNSPQRRPEKIGINSDAEEIKILDIGTGSGCIAIALKKNLPHAEVYATDISEDALKLAVENAKMNSVEIDFLLQNIIAPDLPLPTSDLNLIVSNPPYVLEKEKTSLHKNVLSFEPHLALFVPDQDPLIFYKAIINFAKQNLSSNGLIYFEVNRDYATQVEHLLHDSGFLQSEIKKDLSGNERMIRGKR